MPQHAVNNDLLRWQQAEGLRHAMDGLAPHPDQAIRTLCGIEVIVRRHDIPLLGGLCLDPTCWECDRVWRVRTGLPQLGNPA